MCMNRLTFLLACLVSLLLAVPSAFAGKGVTITPLGSHDGEFCARDRALVFEDPDGTRILFDAGRTVRGADDPRLGKIDAVLLSGVHGDHIGDQRMIEANAGSCSAPESPLKLPNTNTAEIAAAKGARVILGGEMHKFLGAKLVAAGGKAEQVQILRFGGERQVNGVRIAVVPVTHSNGVDPAMLAGELADQFRANGLTAYVGPDNGYILRFTNGLSVYLSGDSGILADQQVTVRGFYGANLAIINAGGIFTSGPDEAAYSINQLIQPRSVIASHMNEAATQDGKLLPETRTAQLVALMGERPIYLPRSGRTMEFDGEAHCIAGCD